MIQDLASESESYRVVFLGLADPSDANVQAFSKELSTRFGIPAEKALRIARNAPIVVKKGITKSKAEQYQQVFVGLGGQVRIEPMEKGPKPHPAQTSTARVVGLETTSIESGGPIGQTRGGAAQEMNPQKDAAIAKAYDDDIAGAYEDSFVPPTHRPSGSSEGSGFKCPQCGQEQEKGTECVKCGIIFEKYERLVEAESQTEADQIPDEGEPPPLTDFEVKIEPAGFWIRLAASFVDNLIISLVSLAIVLVLFWRMIANPMAVAAISPMVYPVFFFLPLAYFIYFLGKKGYTPGKGFLGLQVIRQDGTGMSYGDAAARTLCYIISALPLYLGFLWVGFDRNKQGWHDKIAKTQVIKAEEVPSWRKWVVLVPAVLIPIVGIVAAIGIPVYMGYTSRAQVVKAVSEMQTVKSHLEEHYYRYNRYPLTREFRLFLGNSLGRIPRDPFNHGRSYRYESDGSTFTLWSIGPDRVDNGAAIAYDPFLTRGPQQQGDIILYSDEGAEQGGDLLGMTPSPR